MALVEKTVAIAELEGEQSFLRIVGGKPSARGEPEDFQALRDNIRANGMIFPVSVTPRPRGGRYLVIDGYRRIEVAKALGQKEIRVQIIESDHEPQALRLALNDQYQDLTARQRITLMRDLVKRYSVADVARLTGMHASTIGSLLATADAIVPEVLDALGAEKLAFQTVKNLVAPLRPAVQRAIAKRALASDHALRSKEIRVFVGHDSKKFKEGKMRGLYEGARKGQDPNRIRFIRELTTARADAEVAAAEHRDREALTRRLARHAQAILADAKLAHYVQKNHPKVYRNFHVALEHLGMLP